MKNKVKNLLKKNEYLVGDGAMGTNLFTLGLKSGEPPEIWNISNPDKVKQIHHESILAGSDIILTNSFGANRFRLQLHNAQKRTGELNLTSAKIARSAADAIDRDILVAGSIGPIGEFIEPIGALSISDATKVFSEQAKALQFGGVDVIWIETMSSIQELLAAVNGAVPLGLPIIATMSFDTAGKTMMGISAKELMTFRKKLGDKITAIGANCGVGPATLVSTICELASNSDDKDILVAKANCGIPEFKEGKICYTGTPKMMGVYARLSRDSGATIIGGCCGTSQIHIKEMARILKKEKQGNMPDKSLIESQLGKIDRPKKDSKRRSNTRRRQPL